MSIPKTERLINAAPKMLIALMHLWGYFQGRGIDDPHIINPIREAIIEATGRLP